MTIKRKQRPAKIVLDLTGPDGNAFVILGTVLRLMTDIGYPPERRIEILAEMKSGDYEHLIATADKHFGSLIDFLR